MIPLVQNEFISLTSWHQANLRALARGLVRYMPEGGNGGVSGQAVQSMGPPPICFCLLGFVCWQDCDCSKEGRISVTETETHRWEEM